jgi:HSP20 family protein
MNRMVEENITETSPVEREMLLAVDVQADDEGYNFTALVPGLEADDINVEIINNTVSLSGEFKSTKNEDARYMMSELPAGPFRRVIKLPTALEAAKTEASIQNGVLSLRVPKAESHRPQTVKVIAG